MRTLVAVTLTGLGLATLAAAAIAGTGHPGGNAPPLPPRLLAPAAHPAAAPASLPLLRPAAAATAPASATASVALLPPVVPPVVPQGATPGIRRPGPLSAHIASYRIQATLDPATHTITGREQVTWRNLGTVPARDLELHLYMNAFKNESSTFLEETKEFGGSLGGAADVSDGEWGAIDVKSFKLADGTNVLPLAKVDDTVMTVAPLPTPVAPGQTLQMDIDFVTKLPHVVARSGWVGDFYLVGQWYPELGVWQNGTWNCHQYHSTSEFFADFGEFDVQVTTPKGWPVGATGVLVAQKDGGSTTTRTFHADDVHDFVWSTAPWFREVDGVFTDDQPGKVAVRVLYPPGADAMAARHLKATEQALAWYGKTFFPYPYTTLTVIDPPLDAGEAGGMEYPTFFTTLDGDRSPGPSLFAGGSRFPEETDMHEFGHQYFCQMIATNEFEEPWMDEGLTQYTSSLAMEATYGEDDLVDWHGLDLSSWDLNRLMYLSTGDLDPMETYSWKFADDQSYGAVSYGKTATLLHTLERVYGRDRLLGALRAYATAWDFQHPRDADFEAALSQSLGTDLSPVLGPTIHGTSELDYEVVRVESHPHTAPAGLFDAKDGKRFQVTRDKARKEGEVHGKEVWDSYVLVHRRSGEFALPVDVVVHFADGSTDHRTWDGKGSWHLFSFSERPSRAVGAELDPDRKLWLDSDVLDNSMVVAGGGSDRVTDLATDLASFVEETALQVVGP